MKAKRLLVITNSYPDKDDKHSGGIFVKEQIREISRHFEEVHVIYPSMFGMSHRPREDFRDYVDGNVHVHFLRYFNIPLFMRFGRRAYTFFLRRGLRRLIERDDIQFDIIHAHYTWPSGHAAVALKNSRNVPLVVTEHTSLTFDDAIRSKRREFIDTWNSCDRLIRVRSGDINRLSQIGISAEKVRAVPNGYNNGLFKPLDMLECRRKLGLPADKKIVLTVGILQEVKGHRYLVEAMEKVSKSRKDVLCAIVGGGELEADLASRISKANLGEVVRAVGYRPHNELPVWMNACDVFVLPSLAEGNPIVMFEALGCGKPFVGTAVGGIPEVIVSDDTGLLCEPRDSGRLADLMLEALTREWDGEKILAHASKYAWSEVANQILAVYDEVLR